MQPRRAYSTAIRPELISPVPLSSRGSRRISPRSWPCAQPGEQAQVAVAQVGSAVGDAADAVEDASGIEQAVGIDQEIGPAAAVDLGQHGELEGLVIQAC